MSLFQQKVLEIVRAIPAGSVLTYAEVASRVGSPHASRAVGSVMAKNNDKTVPCHRVIQSDGSVGAYNGLQGKSKQDILEREGVVLSKKGKVVI
jgi:methylated-DNA-[protein]-cysteine S-methyltransferase